MVFESTLNNPFARAAVLLGTLAGCGLLLFATASHFIVRALTDVRVPANREMLALAAQYFSGSPQLNARLSEAELSVADDRDAAVERADQAVSRAITASPFEYRYRVLQASVREAAGDRSGAEAALREAVRLAPGNTDVRWRLANLLVRSGRLAESLAEFHTAVKSRPALLPGALDVIWNVSGGDVGMLGRVAGQEPLSQLALAHFLLRRSRADEAISSFNQTGREARLATGEAATLSAAFITALIAAGRTDEAHRAWLETLGFGSEQLMCDGGFEADIPKGFEQFAWQIGSSEQARFRISNAEGAAHTGRRALRIDFAGRNSTTLGSEIRHQLAVTPGATYRVECFVRTKNLTTPEGPRLAVISESGVTAESAPVAEGTNDWQPLSLEFTAPAGARLLSLTVRRVPKFGYDDPTRGTIWFDDFAVAELKGSR